MHEVQPKAELLDYGSHSANMVRVYAGYRRCYSALEQAEIALPSVRDEFIRKMMRSGHESPLEHASLTFHVTCSRACSHQLVRHRIASYSQQSQRYVKMDDLPYILPPAFGDETNPSRARFLEALKLIEWTYRKNIEDDVAAEDARFILPGCIATHIVVTMNFRSLLHFFEERCCNRAQWEIRSLANQMLEVCKDFYPAVFENAGAKCRKLGHCPESKPCGAGYGKGKA